MKKELILFPLVLLLLSGCGSSKQNSAQYSRNYIRDEVMSELDIDVESDVRSFFDDDEALFSDSEFVGWAESQELLDLDEVPPSESMMAMNEFQAIEEDGETVFVVAENNIAPDLMDEPEVQVETAMDIMYYVTGPAMPYAPTGPGEPGPNIPPYYGWGEDYEAKEEWGVTGPMY